LSFVDTMSIRLALNTAFLGQSAAWSFPEFSWETLPVGFHSSNPAGPYSDAQLKNISKYASATFEKWQGVHQYVEEGYDWMTCQNGSDVKKCGCCLEDEMVSMGKKLKKLNPKIQVLEYLNSQQVYPHYRLGHDVAHRPDLWLRDNDGNVVFAGNGHWVFPDFAKEEAAEMFETGVLNVTRTGHMDGAFIDGCAHSVHNTSPERQIAKTAMLQRLQTEVPGVIVCGSNGVVEDGLAASQIQNWGKGEHWSTREIPMLMKAVEKGAMFQAHGGCPQDPTDQKTINNIAAFLVAAGPYSYYVCGGWNMAPTEWFPLYDFPIGEPLANATLSKNGIWSRSFKHGTKVTFDTNTETGSIVWAQKTVLV